MVFQIARPQVVVRLAACEFGWRARGTSLYRPSPYQPSRVALCRTCSVHPHLACERRVRALVTELMRCNMPSPSRRLLSTRIWYACNYVGCHDIRLSRIQKVTERLHC